MSSTSTTSSRSPRTRADRLSPLSSRPRSQRQATEGMGSPARTLSQKVWERHVVHRAHGEPDLLYVDLHLVHEVTSPQAFDGLRLAGRGVRRPDLTLATMDHNVPTDEHPPEDISARQIEAMAVNAREFGIRCFPVGDANQGIVHVISPQLGLTQPGMTIVCGDSHTSTHGAFGALAFGIGTSEVGHVLATQCLLQGRPRTLAVETDGRLPRGVTAKDLILALIARIGIGGANATLQRALAYMGLQPGQQLLGRPVDVVFIGSCTNSRLSDLRQAATIFAGRKVAPGVRVLVVPGSQQVKRQAEAEGLDRIFR